MQTILGGRLTRLLPLPRSNELPVDVARIPAAPFCETLGVWHRRPTNARAEDSGLCSVTAARIVHRIFLAAGNSGAYNGHA